MMSTMRQLPTGTVTFLFTDIEGSTRLIEELGEEHYIDALTERRRLLREAFCASRAVELVARSAFVGRADVTRSRRGQCVGRSECLPHSLPVALRL